MARTDWRDADPHELFGVWECYEIDGISTPFHYVVIEECGRFTSIRFCGEKPHMTEESLLELVGEGGSAGVTIELEEVIFSSGRIGYAETNQHVLPKTMQFVGIGFTALVGVTDQNRDMLAIGQIHKAIYPPRIPGEPLPLPPHSHPLRLFGLRRLGP